MKVDASTNISADLNNTEEVNACVAQAGELEAEIQRIETAFRARREVIHSQYRALDAERELEIGPLRDKQSRLYLAVRTYADRHRGELLAQGGKSFRVSAGVLFWRFSRGRVTLRGRGQVKDKLERVLAWLRERKMERFIRPSLNKTAILEAYHHGSVEMNFLSEVVKVVQPEKFYMQPDRMGSLALSTTKDGAIRPVTPPEDGAGTTDEAESEE